ncbi:regulatory protein TetR [Novosphingobium sp. Rr 2-17]|uniref:TetR/AcrR family transcriptional regulator n=1 Tax=Novosphingobium sp. Rr 2-17 TaxID=555793 RepID=UPI0002698ED0|nr:TetR/AcrR family transcriptional regulator [Novosphingobium sp. Rr 2-17]EIZ79278.1 regulatory protein TetR [Novosphingobium sp. Rr 2-17]
MTQKRGLKTLLVDEMIAMLIAEQEEPSLRDLAKRVGVSAMASYRHFPNKAALVQAVADKGFAMLQAELELTDASTQGSDALVAQGLAYVNFAVSRPRLFRLMFGDSTVTRAESSARENAHAILTRRIEQVMPARSQGASLACWAVVHGLAVLQIDGGAAFSDRAISEALRATIDGVAAA